MKTTLLPAGCAVLLGLLLSSCEPNTPQARIAASPSLYHHLNDRDQDLVSRGQIGNGMSPDAVYLAWGRASREYVGSEHGKNIQRWDYAGASPVYTQSFGYGGYAGGYGGGYYGPYRRYYSPYTAFGTEVTYLPYRAATVIFENKKVVSWDRARERY